MQKEFIFNQARGWYSDEKGLTCVTTLMLVHGFCGEGSVWDEMKKYLPADYRIITPDLPGYGQAELPASTDVVTIEYYAEYLHAIAEKEQLQDIILIGHSMGGYTALAFAEKFPALIKKLCLFHSHPFEDTSQKKETRQRAMQFIAKYGTRAFVDEFYDTLFTPQFLSTHPEVVNTIKEKASRYQPQTLIASTQAMIRRKDRSEVLKNLSVPVLLIIGGQDKAIEYELSKAMCSLAPITDVHILEEVGHMGMLEAPQQTAQIISNFIEKL